MFHIKQRIPSSPSQFMEYGAPVLKIDNSPDDEIEPTSKDYYPQGHPLSHRGTPGKIRGHPIRAGGTLTHRRVPRQQYERQQRQQQRQLQKQRGHQQSPMPQTPTKRAAWDSTHTDLSKYSLSEEERVRRKRILRTPVDTGRRSKTKSRSKSVAPSPGGSASTNMSSTHKVGGSSKIFTTPKRAWVPSGKTSGKGMVARTPGFVDESWKEFAKDLDEDEQTEAEEQEEQAEQEEQEETYNEIDRQADPYRTPSVKQAQKDMMKTPPVSSVTTAPVFATSSRRNITPSSSVSSFRKPVGTRLSLHTASKAWAKRKEAHPDVFTAQDAAHMSAVNNTSTATTSEQYQRHSQLRTTTTTNPVSLSLPRPMKASTELGRRQRAEQEGAFMELEAQLTRLRIVKGIEQTEPMPPTTEATTNATPEPAKHWIGFHAHMPTTNAVLNNTPTTVTSASYNTRTMLTSLAHVASTLASSLAENEIRLQEESKARENMQDLLLETQSELKHLRAQQSEDSEAIARMITQMPDIALNYLTNTKPDIETSMVAQKEVEVEQVIELEQERYPIPSSPSEYGSLLNNHETTMQEKEMSIKKLQQETDVMTSMDVNAVASLPEMNTSIDQEEEEEVDALASEKRMNTETNGIAGFKPRTTTQMGFTITELVQQNENDMDMDMDEEEMPRTCVPTPRTSVPRPSVTSGPGYRNAVLDSPLSASLGRIDYSSYMKRPPSAAVKIAKTPSPVRKTNAAKAWLKRHKN